MKLNELDTKALTETQLMRKVIVATEDWIKDNGYFGKIKCRYIRGTYYFLNVTNYMLSAQCILHAATGLDFYSLSDSMAKIDPKHLN